jgi:amino acid transporter
LGENVPVVNAILVNACCSHTEQLEASNVQDCLRNCQAFQKPGLAVVGHIVSGGAIFGLMASCFTSLMGQPRIFYRMAQDGLWFRLFAELDPETQVPREGIKLTGIATALLACFVPLEALANLISLGTLMVFTFVDAGVILLRLRTVSEASYSTLTHPQAKEESKRLFERAHQNVTYLLLLFTGSSLGASIVFANSDNKPFVAVLAAVAVITGGLIAYIPDSWNVAHDNAVHGHQTQFNCPSVPVIPLGGVACNSFMMGSLPISSWLFCSRWVACGLGVYFAYGIRHSVLGMKSRYSETAPLVEYGGVGESGGYESTLNISIRPIKD